MSEHVRKRVSKWDRVSEASLPSDMELCDVQPEMAREASINMSELEPTGTEPPKWLNPEPNKRHSELADSNAENEKGSILSSGAGDELFDLNAENEKGSNLSSRAGELDVSKWSDCKNEGHPKDSVGDSAPKRDECRDTNFNQENSNLVTTHRQYFSPTADGHQWNHTLSPKSKRSTSHRSRSRSRSRSRDYDRDNRDRDRDGSWTRIRSRSRSPVRSFNRGGDGWNERRQTSAALCRDFAAGKCKRGADCRYLHDGDRKIHSRHHDALESGEGRYERGQLPGYSGVEQNSDSVVQKDYLHGKGPPGHDNQYSEGLRATDPYRSLKNEQICHDFRRGRCHRGSTCRYIHHSASSDCGWEIKGWSKERSQDERDSKEPFRPERRHDTHRVSDTPCKFFLEGRCRHGDKCRFSHQGVMQNQQGLPFDITVGKDSENKMSWNGPTGGDHAGPVATSSASGWQRDDDNLRAATFATISQVSGPDIQKQQLTYMKDDNKYLALPKVSEAALPAHVQSPSQQTSSHQQQQHGAEFSSQAVLQNAFAQQHSDMGKREDSPRESNSIVINTSITEANKHFHKDEVVKSSISQNGENFNNLPDNPAMIGHSANVIGQKNQCVNPEPSNAHGFSPAGQNQHVVLQPIFNGQVPQMLVNSVPTVGQSHMYAPQLQAGMHSFNIRNQSHQMHPPSFIGQIHQPSHSMPSNQQSPFIAPQIPQSMNYSMDKQAQQRPQPTLSLDNQLHTGPDGQMHKLDNPDTSTSQTSLDTSTQKVVGNEQGTQLSNLSAPLSQIFGNGPELPQLYAALNPHHSSKVVPGAFSHPVSVGSLASTTTTATYVQPVQVPRAQQQHGSLSNSTYLDKVDKSVTTPGLSIDTMEHENTTIGEPQADPKTLALAPLKSTDVAKTADPEKIHEAKQTNMNGDNELKEKGNTTELEEKQTVESEGANANLQADDSSKRNKDVKGTRMFRFALVEFVKDILRPTWKEGQMSKEAHKTIVKKVVEKVTTTLDTNIPQTQERVDLYLSYSKEKLTKLVQAYVDKYLKT